MRARPYLLVSGDFVRTGGMDMANFALARYLADRGDEVHLVAHRVSPDLAARRNIHVHRAPKPIGSYLLGESFLDRLGQRWASIIDRTGGRVVANGGNCRCNANNWVHYVHAAYEPADARSPLPRITRRWTHRRFISKERDALLSSRAIVTNSARTTLDVASCLNLPLNRIHTVYYGVDPDRFHPYSSAERACARSSLGWAQTSPVVLFVGAVSDTRKGFSTLFEAWTRLCGATDWDGHLAVAGDPSGIARWKSQAADAGLQSRIHFIGFRTDMTQVMAACDALVSPTRYEAYGMAVHEGLCCGLPGLITRTAGIAERYPDALDPLLLRDPTDAEEVVGRLRQWRKSAEHFRHEAMKFSNELRARTWDHACKELVDIIETS